MRSRLFRLAALLLVVAVVVLVNRARAPVPLVTVTDFMMDTYVTVTAAADRERQVDALLTELRRLGEIFDRYRPDSCVSRVNAAAGSWVDVDPELVTLLLLLESWSGPTGGLFEPTVGPLVDAWGFGSAAGPGVPTTAELRAALDLVDHSGLEVDADAGRVRLTGPGMSLDLGGVAKGYAMDLAAAAARELGLNAVLLEVGGDILGLGERPGGGYWRIGVQDPRQPDRLTGVLRLVDRAVATSGDYQRYFEADGVRYHHILDPRTGYPGTGTTSVSVVAPSVSEADLLSTAVFLMDPAAGLELVESLAGFECIIVLPGGDVVVSSGLAEGRAGLWFEPR